MSAIIGNIEELHRRIQGRETNFLRSLGITPPPPQRGHIRCPFLDHEDRHPSWRFDHHTGRYHCTCGHGDIFDFTRRYFGVDFHRAKNIVADFVSSGLAPSTSMPEKHPPARNHRDHANTKRWSEYAEDIWSSCSPISGVAEAYLRCRSCCIPPEDGDLRWHRDLSHKISNKSGPALVARVTDPITAEAMTLHRTWIKSDGYKADLKPARMFLKGHAKSGGVVRLWPDEAVIYGLAIAEGIESALSVAHAFTPAWAALDKDNLRQFPVLSGVDAITIFADNDNDGQNAANTCAERWLAAGREVRPWSSPIDNQDPNDWVQK